MSDADARQRKARALRKAILAGDLSAARRMLERARAGRAKAKDIPGPETLERACPGAVVRAGSGGGARECYRIVRPLAGVADDAQAVAAEYVAVLRGQRERFDELAASAGLCRLADADPADVLLCRIQPCRKDRPIVLAGCVAVRRGIPTVEQLLARRAEEEPAVLAYLAECLPAYAVLATYKDARLETNRLAARAGELGVTWPTPKGPPDNRMPAHLDLRAEVRRRWQGRLGGFSLPRVERSLCRRARPAGVNRLDPPAIYERFTATGDARELANLLHANALDLLTMAQLVALLLTGTEPPDLN